MSKIKEIVDEKCWHLDYLIKNNEEFITGIENRIAAAKKSNEKYRKERAEIEVAIAAEFEAACNNMGADSIQGVGDG